MKINFETQRLKKWKCCFNSDEFTSCMTKFGFSFSFVVQLTFVIFEHSWEFSILTIFSKYHFHFICTTKKINWKRNGKKGKNVWKYFTVKLNVHILLLKLPQIFLVHFLRIEPNRKSCDENANCVLHMR